MLSSGQQVPQQQQVPGAYPGMGYGMAYGPSLQPPGLIPYSQPASSMPSIAIESKNWDDSDDKKNLVGIMWGGVGLQAIGAIGGIINQVMNGKLASQSMSAQLELGKKYYEVQDNISARTQGTQLAQVALQSKAVEAQQTMHQQQCNHEEKMQELVGSIDKQKTEIIEKEKTNRFHMAQLSEAFSRRRWNSGTPAVRI